MQSGSESYYDFMQATLWAIQGLEARVDRMEQSVRRIQEKRACRHLERTPSQFGEICDNCNMRLTST